MEELTILIEMVSELPQMALWVLIGFFIYKVVVVGSIFGVFRLLILKAHSWLTTPKKELRQIELEATIDGMVITHGEGGNVKYLISQIRRLIGIRTKIDCPTYIFKRDIDWLKEAIDEKIERERKN